MADNLIAGRDILEGDGRVDGIDAGIDDQQNIIFGDHGEVVQLVADPNLPPLLLQKIQTTALDTVLEINSLEPQNGADDIIFGTTIADLLIGGGGNDMIDGREGDDLIFGDNVFLTRMGGADGNLVDDILNARFQALAGTVLYSRTDLSDEEMGLAGIVITSYSIHYTKLYDTRTKPSCASKGMTTTTCSSSAPSRWQRPPTSTGMATARSTRPTSMPAWRSSPPPMQAVICLPIPTVMAVSTTSICC